MLSRNDLIFKLGNLQRLLQNFDPDFFAEAVNKEAYAGYLSDTIALLKERNTVICKECKYFNDYFAECEKNNHTHGAAWHCADGERRTDDA